MKEQFAVVGPTSTTPFRIEGVQYLPERSSPSHASGYTIIMFHAVNLHKETYRAFFRHLLDDCPEANVREVWSLDNPNSGRSSGLNAELMASPQYVNFWNATYYAEAVHAFLSSSPLGVNFRQRNLIAMAHSGGATSLVTLQTIQPTFQFKTLILLDPAIMPPNNPEYGKWLMSRHGKWAKTKKSIWPSRIQAYKELSEHAAFAGWKPELVDLFIEHALLCKGPSGEVSLACSGAQEAAFYLDAEDAVIPPGVIFADICKNHTVPVQLVVILDDGYKGGTKIMKAFQVETLQQTKNGVIHFMEKGGHMFPQVEPMATARAITDIIKGLSSVRDSTRSSQYETRPKL